MGCLLIQLLTYNKLVSQNGHMKNLMIPIEVSYEGYFKFLHDVIENDDEIYIMRADRESFINEINKSLKG